MILNPFQLRFVSLARATSSAARCVVLLVALIFLQDMAIAQSGTSVSGSISANTTWTTSGSPYMVSGDVSVTSGATLTIQAGVTVLFAVGTNFTITSGSVIARSLAGQPIVFTSVRDSAGAGTAPAPGDWGQVRFNAGTSTLTDFDGVEFRFGSGIVVNGASPTLNRVIIRNMSGAAMTVDLAASPRGVDLTATGNQLNGVRVPTGDISGNVTWAITGIPYVVETGIVGVGASANISSISPNVFLIGQTANATIIGTGLSTVESLVIDRPGVTITAGSGATATSIPVTVSVAAGVTPSAGVVTAVVAAGTVSTPVSIVTNLPPTVTLSVPTTGTEYTSPATIAFAATANATNPSASISKVEFLRDGVLITGAVSLNATTGVYSQTWTNVAAGTYVLTARATDSLNISTTSAPVTVTVIAGPTVTVTAPVNGTRASTTLPLPVSASATSNVAGVSINKVEFISHLGAVFGTVTSGVNNIYSAVWTNIPGGANWFVARATDSRGGVGTSTQLDFTGITAPDVVMSAPANNASFVGVPANITLSANASSVWSGQGITITKVEFYEGRNLVGSVTSGTNSVFSVTWTATTVGTFGITAKASDSVGGSRTSVPIAVSIGATQPKLPYALLGLVKGDVTSNATPTARTQYSAAVGVIRGDVTANPSSVAGALVSRPLGVIRGDVTSAATGTVGPITSSVVGITK